MNFKEYKELFCPNYGKYTVMEKKMAQKDYQNHITKTPPTMPAPLPAFCKVEPYGKFPNDNILSMYTDMLASTITVVAMPTNTCTNNKEKSMYIDTDETDTQNAKRYLIERMRDVAEGKETVARKAFGLADDDAPTTAAELLERIKTGMFVVDEKNMDKRVYGSPIQFFQWKDPAKKADPLGFKKAEETFAAAKTKVSDAIMVKTPAEALAALEELEATKFH